MAVSGPDVVLNLLLLSLTSQSSCLNLAQGPGSTEENNGSKYGGCWESLEKVPGRVVQEEDTLESGDAAEKQGVGNRVSAHGLANVVEVGAKQDPCSKEDRQGGGDCQGEEVGDDLWW